MTTDEEVRKITTDLQSVTILVARLGTMQENSEKRIDTLTGVTQEAVNGMNRLNERMSATVGMERDIAGIKETLGERFGDIRAIRHDLNNVLTGMAGIPILNDKISDNAKLIAAQGAKIEGLESFRDRLDGAGIAGLAKRVDELEKQKSTENGAMTAIKGTAKTFWAVFSTPIWVAATAVGVWILTQMYSGKGPIGGE